MNDKIRILLVEDEPEIRRFLRTSLSSQGYRVLEAVTGADGLALAAQQMPDVLLLDLGLPDMDGLALLKRLREWSKVPVIVLSARGHERQKVDALDAGADDYLTKPFGLSELLARLRVALRHTAPAQESEGGERTVGPLTVNFGTRQVRVNGTEVHLTPIEFRILSVLLAHAGRVVTQKQLLHDAWGPPGVDRGDSLRVFMAHLRRKLDPGHGRRLFHTEAGVGYRLIDDEADEA